MKKNTEKIEMLLRPPDSLKYLVSDPNRPRTNKENKRLADWYVSLCNPTTKVRKEPSEDDLFTHLYTDAVNHSKPVTIRFADYGDDYYVCVEDIAQALRYDKFKGQINNWKSQKALTPDHIKVIGNKAYVNCDGQAAIFTNTKKAKPASRLEPFIEQIRANGRLPPLPRKHRTSIQDEYLECLAITMYDSYNEAFFELCPNSPHPNKKANKTYFVDLEIVVAEAFSFIIEIDEKGHAGYSPEEEAARTAHLESLNKPIIRCNTAKEEAQDFADRVLAEIRAFIGDDESEEEEQ